MFWCSRRKNGKNLWVQNSITLTHKKRRYCQFGNNIAMINLTDALIKYAYCPVIKLVPENTERMQIMSCESIQQNAFKAVYANKIEHIFLEWICAAGVLGMVAVAEGIFDGQYLESFSYYYNILFGSCKGDWWYVRFQITTNICMSVNELDMCIVCDFCLIIDIDTGRVNVSPFHGWCHCAWIVVYCLHISNETYKHCKLREYG